MTREATGKLTCDRCGAVIPANAQYHHSKWPYTVGVAVVGRSLKEWPKPEIHGGEESITLDICCKCAPEVGLQNR